MKIELKAKVKPCATLNEFFGWNGSMSEKNDVINVQHFDNCIICAYRLATGDVEKMFYRMRSAVSEIPVLYDALDFAERLCSKGYAITDYLTMASGDNVRYCVQWCDSHSQMISVKVLFAGCTDEVDE